MKCLSNEKWMHRFRYRCDKCDVEESREFWEEPVKQVKDKRVNYNLLMDQLT